MFYFYMFVYINVYSLDVRGRVLGQLYKQNIYFVQNTTQQICVLKL